jgi:hypothetical protein
MNLLGRFYIWGRRLRGDCLECGHRKRDHQTKVNDQRAGDWDDFIILPCPNCEGARYNRPRANYIAGEVLLFVFAVSVLALAPLVIMMCPVRYIIGFVTALALVILLGEYLMRG